MIIIIKFIDWFYVIFIFMLINLVYNINVIWMIFYSWYEFVNVNLGFIEIIDEINLLFVGLSGIFESGGSSFIGLFIRIVWYYM